MPSLKSYRDRITSVKSTKKITSAMKMVAASKLKKAQDRAEAAQPYAVAMAEVMGRVAAGIQIGSNSPKLLSGTGRDQTHLLVVITSDRGLAGGFNANLVRQARELIRALKGAGKTVKLIPIGRKARDLLRREYDADILRSFLDVGRNGVQFAEALGISEYILGLYEEGKFDVCMVLGNEFRSVLVQTPVAHQLIPFKLPEPNAREDVSPVKGPAMIQAPYDFEPGEEEILVDLLPRNIAVQIFRALLDSAAGEQAARMTAMDNATRNAGDRIKQLTLEYNRARQAHITNELIEIISGAEAV